MKDVFLGICGNCFYLFSEPNSILQLHKVTLPENFNAALPLTSIVPLK